MPLDAGGQNSTQMVLAPGASIFRCRQCGQTISRRDWLLPMGGDHEHVVFNPAGMIFRVWCFSLAQGLRLIGAPSGNLAGSRAMTGPSPCAANAAAIWAGIMKAAANRKLSSV